MITTKTKRKIIVTIVDIESFERFRTFDIKLPSNTVRVTGVMVVTSAKPQIFP